MNFFHDPSRQLLKLIFLQALFRKVFDLTQNNSINRMEVHSNPLKKHVGDSHFHKLALLELRGAFGDEIAIFQLFPELRGGCKGLISSKESSHEV